MLPIQEREKIEEKALYQRRMYDLGDESPIGLKIFSIIENVYNSFILLYPFKTKNVAGFTKKQGDLIQIFVNTGFNLNYQVFAAAHELYHLIELRENNSNKIIICNNKDISEGIEDTILDINETKANYFSVALLMPQSVIKKRFNNFEDKKYHEEDLILKILELQYEYEIPYKTILKRLIELKIIGSTRYKKLKDYDKRTSEYCSMLDMEMQKHINELEKPNKRKYHSLNVPKMAYDAYRDNIITVSKLESIVGRYGKALKDFKVCEPKIKPIDIDFSNFGAGDGDNEEN